MENTERMGSTDTASVSTEEKLALYQGMLFARMIEEKMLLLLRQGKVSKWFSGIGQEAISTAITLATQPDEFLFPLHRNLGVFTGRKVPLSRLIAQWQGKTTGYTRGRDRSFHFGVPEHHIVGMISHLGPQLALADGVALARLLGGESKVTVAFTGEGGTSEGDFHEALNLAAVWQLPVIFVIENNGYALSTPTDQQYRAKDLADHGAGYGMKSFVLDGNDAVGLFAFMQKWTDQLRREPEPILVECKTFRMRGHEEASGVKYVPAELLDAWADKDPIERLEHSLKLEGILTDDLIAQYRSEYKQEIQEAVDWAFAQPDPVPEPTLELEDVYKPVITDVLPEPAPGDRTLRMVDALAEALDQAMKFNDKLVLMGQDIADYGGVFKVTAGLVEQYGPERVRNTPLCESAVIGAGLGLSLAGFAAMVEMQFSDFVSCGFNQIVNNLAKLHYRWGHAPNVTIRMPAGGGVGAGPFHSQTSEAWFMHVPGLKIVYPSNAFDAKGLLLASLQDPNPVLFFEHKLLYRSSENAVPEAPYALAIGKARRVREGTKAAIITYGLGVKWACDLVDEEQLPVEVLDLRTLQPIDWEMVEQSVKHSGKVLILHEANLTAGVGAELAAVISERWFEFLDAPVIRCASLDTPVPFSRVLEESYLAKNRLSEKLKYLLKY